MTKKELLLDTINHYNVNNRCVSNGNCRYSPKILGLEGVSKGCAIGRFLDPELAYKIDEENGEIAMERLIEKDYPLPEWMRNMSISFLQEIQTLHDIASNWNETGLSEYGKLVVNEICKLYNIELN